MRYSLVAPIRPMEALDVEVDLYTPIATEIKVANEVVIERSERIGSVWLSG